MSGVVRVRNVYGLMCHRHGLSTGESSRDRHERHIFRRPFLHRLGLADNVCLLAELMELLVLVLEALATEAESLGLEVNWQALGNIQDVPPPSVTVLEQQVSTVEEFVYLGTLIHSTHSSPDILRRSAFTRTAALVVENLAVN